MAVLPEVDLPPRLHFDLDDITDLPKINSVGCSEGGEAAADERTGSRRGRAAMTAGHPERGGPHRGVLAAPRARPPATSGSRYGQTSTPRAPSFPAVAGRTGLRWDPFERSSGLGGRRAEFLPVLFRHVERDFQRAVRPGELRLLDRGHFAAAVLIERFLDGPAERANLAAAAAQEDVVAHLGLELRVIGGDQLLERLDRRRND